MEAFFFQGGRGFFSGGAGWGWGWGGGGMENGEGGQATHLSVRGLTALEVLVHLLCCLLQSLDVGHQPCPLHPAV